MIMTNVRLGDFFVVEAAGPFSGVITVVRVNGKKCLCFDFPDSVKIVENPDTEENDIIVLTPGLDMPNIPGE